MEKVIPMSWLNQILLVLSIAAAILSLVVQGWMDLLPLPIYVSISWAIFVTIVSIWLSCCLLRLTLKANSPIAVEFVNKWIYKRLTSHLSSIDKDKSSEIVSKGVSENQKNSSSAQESSVKCNSNAISEGTCNKIPSIERKKLNCMIKEINTKCIDIWYKNISNDKSFPDEAQELLKKFLIDLFQKASQIDKVKLTNKLANVVLLHLKEYRRYVDILELRDLCLILRLKICYLYIHFAEHYAESKKVLQLVWKKRTNICIPVLAVRLR